MQRVLAAAVAAAALVTASPAQAAVDPVKALKKQFVTGHGVKISEVARMRSKGEKPEIVQITGTLAFSGSGVVASDMTMRGFRTKATLRFLVVGKQLYLHAGEFGGRLPEGKTWVRMGDATNASATTQPVDIFRLRELKGLLSHAGSAKSGLYRGSLTSGQTRKVTGGRGDQSFGYRLTIGSNGLPSRLFTDSKVAVDRHLWLRETTDTRYTAWGHKVTIEAPPEDQVIDADEADAALDEVRDELQIISNEALATR
ncbi:hypothetical protein [Nonomuraea sp. NPDC049695]|uniref:hypothetical protein n=1 Tax=Nonomuraea sp. NPDC049695 TaxID=3154734 RepID=UPI00342D8E5E